MRPTTTRAVSTTRQRTPLAAVALGVCAVVLAGCANGIAGTAAADPEAVPPAGKPIGYTPANFDIKYAQPDGADQIARDALADVISEYSSWYPQVFGHEFTPPTGGYFSIAPGEGHQSGCMTGPDDESIVDNAFYCHNKDEVAYWRPLLDEFASEYSDMQVGLVLAHELGHTIQYREGMSDMLSIVLETQADCFAGSWARSVADGRDPHFKFNPENLDKTLLAWARELPGQLGADPTAEGEHGSTFDRVTAIIEGYQQGPEACRDHFNNQRRFTQAEFDRTSGNASDDGQGNATYERSLDIGKATYDAFYAAKFAELGGNWKSPALIFGGSGDPSCVSTEVVSYCQANNSVVISNQDALRGVHDKYGDFAMVTAMGLAYGTAAIVELGYSAQDPKAMLAATCLTGAAAGELIDPANPYQVILSPGDFDEATVMLLSADATNPVVDTGGSTAFDRMENFRYGVNGNVTSCGVSG